MNYLYLFVSIVGMGLGSVDLADTMVKIRQAYDRDIIGRRQVLEGRAEAADMEEMRSLLIEFNAQMNIVDAVAGETNTTSGGRMLRAVGDATKPIGVVPEIMVGVYVSDLTNIITIVNSAQALCREVLSTYVIPQEWHLGAQKALERFNESELIYKKEIADWQEFFRQTKVDKLT